MKNRVKETRIKQRMHIFCFQNELHCNLHGIEGKQE